MVPRAVHIDPIKMTAMIEEYYTRERPDDLQRRERGLGTGWIQQTESEWSQLIAMLELTQRWHELIGELADEDAHPGADCLHSASRSSGGSERRQIRQRPTRVPDLHLLAPLELGLIDDS